MLCRSCYHTPLVVQRYLTRFHIKSRVWNIISRATAEVFMWNQFIVIKLWLQKVKTGRSRWGDSSFAKPTFSSAEKTTRWKSWTLQMPPPRTADVWLPAADCAGHSTFQAFSRKRERPPQPLDALGSGSGQILTQKNAFQLTKNTTGLSSTHLVTPWVTF